MEQCEMEARIVTMDPKDTPQNHPTAHTNKKTHHINLNKHREIKDFFVQFNCTLGWATRKSASRSKL